MQNKLNVVLVGPAFPLRGGIAQFNESFARTLLDQGHEVHIVSFYYQYPKWLFPGKTQLAPGIAPAGLSIHNWLSSINPFSWWKASRKIAQLEPDLVFVRYWLPYMAPALGSLIRGLNRRKIRTVALVDNAIPHESRLSDKFLSPYFFKSAKSFFSLSAQVAEDIKMLAPAKPVSWSPHPIYDHFAPAIRKDIAQKQLGLKLGEKYILFFGFVRPYKGLDLLIAALSKVKSYPINLIVAGEFYEARASYVKQIEALGLTDRIIIRADYIPDSEVPALFSAVDLVAQTYKTATQSGVTQIAYHFERPMLVTNVGGLAEIVPDGKVGVVVAPNAKAIAKGLERFYDLNLEPTFTANIRTEKERFSWKYFTQQILDFAENNKY